MGNNAASFSEQNGSILPNVSTTEKSEIFDWIEALVTALCVVVILFVFLMRIIGVDGQSMYPTLHDRDTVVISNLFYHPKQGDIVVLTKKSFMTKPIVKRIIAVGGQTIDINFQTHEVKVDGVVQNESYINEPTSLFEGTQFPLTVPKGSVFVMGDNRNNSSDSRDSRLGVVDERYILGRVLFRLFPISRFGNIH
ncbi:MAG: signal peptidase I [Clostridiales bacterium]|nr:signal peptidase I [Clostridiales bacterium]